MIAVIPVDESAPTQHLVVPSEQRLLPFPSNWSAAQFASGPYPLSEPESHALVEYITSRPNIAAIHTYHTSGGLLLRFPTLADQDWEFPQADLEDYRAIAKTPNTFDPQSLNTPCPGLIRSTITCFS